MKNVHDIIIEKNLEFILPRYMFCQDMAMKAKIAVVVHLYYLEKLDYYWNYIKHICDEIDVYLISSNINLLKKVEEQKRILNKSNMYLIQKDNRGRDISALLVSFGKKIHDYEYLCFVHDKRVKSEQMEQDIWFWNENLWGNMIGSEEQIKNILFVFENNPNIGLLVPPKPGGQRMQFDFHSSWGSNYNNTVQLAEQLGLECQIDFKVSPVALGSVFWCKTRAMYKLFDKEWTYADFMQEPLPDDGTISHAIERILPFVAQDAGFDTGIVMSEYYAIKYQHSAIQNKIALFDLLDSVLGVPSNKYLWKYEERMKKICEYFNQHENTYIYGAGKAGKQCFKALQLNGNTPKGFIITNSISEMKNYLGIPVITFNGYAHKEKNGIIIAMHKEEYVKEVVKMLSDKNITDFMIY